MFESKVVSLICMVVTVSAQLGSFKRCQTSTCPGPFTCYDINGAEICIHSSPTCPAPQFTQTRCQSSCMADQQCLTPTSLPGTKCCNLGPCQACVNPNFFLRSKVKVISGTGFPNSGIPNTGFPNTGTPNTGYPNSGTPNTGFPNSGTPNTGFPNSGTPNTEFPNSGTPNTGYPNLGYPNTGIPNTGYPNTGYPNTRTPNTGFPNTGTPNTGFPNTGIPNTGYPNTGYPNTGIPNTGYPNSGIPNTGYPNTGFPNSGTPNSGFPTAGNMNNPAPLAEEQPQLGPIPTLSQSVGDVNTPDSNPDKEKGIIPGAGLHSAGTQDSVDNTASSTKDISGTDAYGAIVGGNLNNPITEGLPAQLPADPQGMPAQIPAYPHVLHKADQKQLPKQLQSMPDNQSLQDEEGEMVADKAENLTPVFS